MENRYPRSAGTHLAAECTKHLDSLVDLLRGKLPTQVMELVTRKPDGFGSSRAVGVPLRREADADADGRRDDVEESRSAFGDPRNIRVVEIAVELVAHGHGPARLIDAQHGRA